MWNRALVIISMAVLLATLVPKESEAFDISGGAVWQNRVGPGIGFGVGLNGCGDDVCRRDWGTTYSVGNLIGFHYRLIPNLVFFGELHTGHIPVDYDFGQVQKDNGFIFEMTGGAEFHLPITGWVAPYAGFGMGFIYLGSWVETRSVDYHFRYGGFDFQFRTGADFFPFSKVPNLSLGPVILISTPGWVKACADADGTETCDHPDDYVERNRRDNLPKPVFIGAVGKLWF